MTMDKASILALAETVERAEGAEHIIAAVRRAILQAMKDGSGNYLSETQHLGDIGLCDEQPAGWLDMVCIDGDFDMTAVARSGTAAALRAIADEMD